MIQRFSLLKQLGYWLGLVILICPLLGYAWLCSLRPLQPSPEQPLFQGITYQREVRSQPRPMVIHQITLDLQAPGIEAWVTPGSPAPDDTEFEALTTSKFLQASQVELAINANFFHPFREETPWSFYPHQGDRVNALGTSISAGTQDSPPQAKWPTICFLPGQRAVMTETQCPKSTLQAVSGIELFVSKGHLVGSLVKTSAQAARTAIALDAQGQTVWIIVVDGKQPFYSEGATLKELATLVISLGADTALNLDGGGSSTLVIATPSGPAVLNTPIHTKIPLRERPVANHLGFHALPL